MHVSHRNHPISVWLPVAVFLICGSLAAAPRQAVQGGAADAQKHANAQQPAPDAAPSGAPAQNDASSKQNDDDNKPVPKPRAGSPAATRRDAWIILTDGLAEKISDRRVQAISALATIGARPDVVRQIELALKDENFLVRRTAAVSLGQIKSRSSIPKLREALDDDSADVSFAPHRRCWRWATAAA